MLDIGRFRAVLIQFLWTLHLNLIISKKKVTSFLCVCLKRHKIFQLLPTDFPSCLISSIVLHTTCIKAITGKRKRTTYYCPEPVRLLCLGLVVQLLGCVRLFVTPWTASRQTFLSFIISEFAQTHVHWVGDAIQPSGPLLSPSSLPAFNLSQHHCLFQWISSSH